MSEDLRGIGHTVRNMLTRSREAERKPQIPARARLGILRFTHKGNARFVTANICLRRSTPAGTEKLSTALNGRSSRVLQDVKLRRVAVYDRDGYSPAEKRELRIRYGCGRPLRDKTKAGIARHRDLVEQVNREAREAARAKAEAQVHAS